MFIYLPQLIEWYNYLLFALFIVFIYSKTFIYLMFIYCGVFTTVNRVASLLLYALFIYFFIYSKTYLFINLVAFIVIYSLVIHSGTRWCWGAQVLIQLYLRCHNSCFIKGMCICSACQILILCTLTSNRLYYITNIWCKLCLNYSAYVFVMPYSRALPS